jgi:2-polyprenyl-3-methyl-5-hydroxy-6-metoxy-1,4-benzoquinol methylase
MGRWDRSNFEIVVDPTYGYRRLEPMPSDEEFERYYQSQYYTPQHVPQPLRRLLEESEERDRERSWLGETLFDDVVAALAEHGRGKRVLDLGCGTGDLVHWLVEAGYDAAGVEPSDDVAQMARERGLTVRTGTLGDLIADSQTPPAYDAVVMLNVLEHVPRPGDLLRAIRSVLVPDGLLFVRVPNDFNALQEPARRKHDLEPWWISPPDHVNYFDASTLTEFGRRLGFETLDVQADFPMELFLLMGLNYVEDPEVGATCHAYRVQAELSLPADVRRELFRTFAAGGIGRNLRVVMRATPRS